jgi:hypothetical protein
VAKLTRKKLQEIIEQADPSTQLVDTNAAGDRPATAAADFDTPDIDQLRTKFLGENAAPEATKPAKSAKKSAKKSATAKSAKPKGASDDDISIVSVEKKQKSDPWDRGSRPKAVVVSDEEGRIIGRQG